MSFDIGFDFRATIGYVTDPSGDVFVVGTDSYPHTYNNGATSTSGGFTQGSRSSRDRSTSVDPRLAGIIFSANNTATPSIFEIDLPAAGAYSIQLAVGDATATQTHHIILFDGATQILNINNVTTSPAQFIDATGTLRTSSADWVANQTPLSYTFVGTVLTIQIGGNFSLASNSTIAHIRITASGGGTTYNQTVGPAGLTPSGSLGTVSMFNEVLTGAGLTPSGSITKLISKLLTAAGLMPTGGLVKKANKVLTSASLTPSGSMVTSFLYKQALAGVLTFIGALTAVKSAGSTAISWLSVSLRGSTKRGGY